MLATVLKLIKENHNIKTDKGLEEMLRLGDRILNHWRKEKKDFPAALIDHLAGCDKCKKNISLDTLLIGRQPSLDGCFLPEGAITREELHMIAIMIDTMGKLDAEHRGSFLRFMRDSIAGALLEMGEKHDTKTVSEATQPHVPPPKARRNA